MSQLMIEGGAKLSGNVEIAGNKNAVLPCLAASIMGNSKSTFTNVPKIEDVKVSIELLKSLGCQVEWHDHTLTIDPSTISTHELNPDLVAKLRASILYLGPLLSRFGHARMRHPGGCIIGRRPVGTHFDAIAQLGGNVIANEEGNYQADMVGEPLDEIFLDEVSVTATENAMCLAASQEHTVKILGAACEPHVVNLAKYLIAMGAKIEGAGTNTITITGTKELRGADHEISPDYIETATFAIMAAATGSQITINKCEEGDFHMVGTYLKHFGVNFEFHDPHTLEIYPSELKAPENIKEVQTRPWPGFPTDALSPLVVLATQAQGSTLFHEWMYEGRLLFADMLSAMGAKVITCDPHRIIVSGKTKLRGKKLASPDIRAGIALVIAGLLAEGQTVIDNSQLIYRGYEDIAIRLRALGANIQEVN